jgi:putative transposase
LTGDIAAKLRQIIKQICAKEQVEIVKGSVSPDHVRLFLSLKPKTAMSDLLSQFKEKTSEALILAFDSLRERYIATDMWSEGFLCCTEGDVTDDDIKKYVSQPTTDFGDDAFTID